ncbi:hypothetical protein RF11_05493 [Thelohanellus kitauei]|uniref:Uncharacterized protein n=1 Tax=Thelohanellus kitauei TaxID=669202 RepID=A0A0C2J6D9_THEKT|nr:hypothetical protein RF11_05493 [Thelohanellus kitauei]
MNITQERKIDNYNPQKLDNTRSESQNIAVNLIPPQSSPPDLLTKYKDIDNKPPSSSEDDTTRLIKPIPEQNVSPTQSMETTKSGNVYQNIAGWNWDDEW